MIRKLKIQKVAYSVERRAYRQNLSAIRYPLNAITYIFCLLFLAPPCYAQSISSSELINNAKQYDGKIVTYAGEVIGDIMLRGEYAWINVNDGKNALGVWLHKDLTKDIVYTGSYKSFGDWVEVTGIFQRACAQHGADLDIHAKALRKITPGRQRIEKINLSKQKFIFILLGILCLVLILRQLKPK